MMMRWGFPSVDQVALNVDGCSYGNPGRAGYGGIFRDHEGKWLMGFIGHKDFADSLEVELLAILNGLWLAWDRGFTKISCRSDSKKALYLIKDPTFEPVDNKYAEILHKINKLRFGANLSISFLHEHREVNQCADFMAKAGANRNENFEFFPEAPEELLPILKYEAMGLPYRRL